VGRKKLVKKCENLAKRVDKSMNYIIIKSRAEQSRAEQSRAEQSRD